MRRIKTIQKLLDYGVVAVVRAASSEMALKTIEAIVNGGIKAIEITMTVPGSIDVIKDMAEKYKNSDVIIGAGTVLDPETARICILNGAEFVVSPQLNADTVKLCNRYAIPVIPGVMTVKEAVEALEYGVEIIKLFPGNAYGPAIIQSFKGPLPQANFMPTGGVNLQNVKEWVKKGAVAIGTGSELTRGAENGDFAAVSEMAQKFVEELKRAREGA
jgi:2-dehydro-3-deoxyphosphogluconate aldolase/(4S)-4-hydroxy-2-oxoglutarate aldolase